MASVTVSTLFLALILFFAYFNLPINGRNLAKDGNTSETTSDQGETITKTQRPAGIMESRLSANIISPSMGQEPGRKTHYASWDTEKGEWHGATAKINVWKIPNVQPQAHSSGYIAALNYESGKDSIAAGVHVYPSLYQNDHDTHFFTYWSKDDGKSTGCYNMMCDGFVLANASNLIPGFKLQPLSSYGGKGYYLTLRIKKDEQTGDWSLYREDKGGPIGGMTLVGWWPKTLLTGLANFATKIQFNGAVSYQVNETSPPMGSGHLSDKGEGKAAYLKNLLVFDNKGDDYKLNDGDVDSYEDADECYTASDWLESKEDGHYFYYGGPSGCKY